MSTDSIQQTRKDHTAEKPLATSSSFAAQNAVLLSVYLKMICTVERAWAEWEVNQG